MKITVNLDTQAVITQPAPLRFKAGCFNPVEISFTRNSQPVPLPEGAVIEYALKPRKQWTGGLLAYLNVFIVGTGNLYFGLLNCATAALLSALGICDQVQVNDLAQLDASAEVTWSFGGQKFRSTTFPVIIESPLTDENPIPSPDPELYPVPSKIALRSEIPQLPVLGTAASLDAGAANGVATLGADGKVPSNQLPAIPQSTTSKFFQVNDASARLALTGEQVRVGDLVEQADTRAVYQVLDTTLLDQETGYVQVGTRTGGASLLSNDLLAYWNLDEETGVRLDATGNGYDLTDINSTTFVPGKIGNAAQFNGSNYLSGVPLYEAMDGKSFSISFWAQFDPSAQLDQSVNGPGIGFVDRQGSLHLDLWYTDTVGPEGWYIVHWTGSYANVFAPAPLDTGWHHYALTFDVATQTMQLWVDGLMTGSDSSFAPNPTVNGFQLGLADGFLVGCMDEAGVWQRVLSDLEIAQLYNSGNGLSYPFA